jgi:hypothetical protein
MTFRALKYPKHLQESLLGGGGGECGMRKEKMGTVHVTNVNRPNLFIIVNMHFLPTLFNCVGYVASNGDLIVSGEYEGVSKSFCLERELQMVQLYATRRSCIAIL